MQSAAEVKIYTFSALAYDLMNSSRNLTWFNSSMAIGYQNIIAWQTEVGVAPGIVSAEDRREIQIGKNLLH